MLECAAEVTARVMVEGEVGVSIGGLGVVSAEDALLKNDALGLELDGLEEVSELELNGSQLGDAGSNLLVHRASDLEEGVDALGIQLEGALEGSIFIALLG